MARRPDPAPDRKAPWTSLAEAKSTSAAFLERGRGGARNRRPAAPVPLPLEPRSAEHPSDQPERADCRKRFVTGEPVDGQHSPGTGARSSSFKAQKNTAADAVEPEMTTCASSSACSRGAEGLAGQAVRRPASGGAGPFGGRLTEGLQQAGRGQPAWGARISRPGLDGRVIKLSVRRGSLPARPQPTSGPSTYCSPFLRARRRGRRRGGGPASACAGEAGRRVRGLQLPSGRSRLRVPWVETRPSGPRTGFRYAGAPELQKAQGESRRRPRRRRRACPGDP